MKKNLRYIIAFLLALMMLLSLCACAQTGTAGNSGELDLDYVGEDTDQPEEEKPWYSWFTEAFSFGKTFSINYGGGLKLRRLMGPIGLNVDVRGYTLPDVRDGSLHFIQTSAGLVISW